ncbi:DUF805 domain-containing protein [Pseudomonas sp. LS1212]|uniref:DUF805 domain-containing protein n=1 Tax=Pseudomonas sp. LS1212 TaxID=2972478 RepID=UPI00215C477D|nr:DUF805 domain-containing protein [Pseudomonas sp. LS1212]UVJ43578.1 DUF805 domain-containing protein [Pseudomonas sp. LS1212]
MTEPRFNIVFDGRLLPGVDLMTAKSNLAALFKSDLAGIEKLFNGRKLILKRNLPSPEAQRYLNALHKAGVDARLEEELRPEDTIQSAPSSSTGEQVTPAAQPSSPYAPPQSQVDQPQAQYAEPKVFSIEGRIGRLRYLAWTLVLLLAVVAVMGACRLLLYESPVLVGVLMTIAGVGFLVVSIQIGVQRLHDLGWSGWLWLLNLIPLASSVFALVLLVLPGNPGHNPYGPPPPPNSTMVKVLACMWVVVLAIGIAMGLLGWLAALLNEYSQ